MRQNLLLFKLVFKGSGIKIYHATAETEIYDPPHWWRKARDAKRMIEEYISLFYNSSVISAVIRGLGISKGNIENISLGIVGKLGLVNQGRFFCHRTPRGKRFFIA